VVEAVKREVDVAVVVGDADLGAMVSGHRVAADGLVRFPPIGRNGQRRARPHRVVHDPVDPWRLGDSLHGELVDPLRASDGRQQHAQHRKDANGLHEGTRQ
jgi:hypothetical protein